ncbi:MAG: Gfo/Idh/MocA family oxidoreductase [Acidobacteriaceae bacterium]
MLRIDRRAFNKLSALALAGSRIPSFAQAPTAATQQPVGYAAIGLGAISDIFMRACANSKTAKITALVTGHPDTKGKKYAAMYGIPETSIYTYETFDKIADNKTVDAVYVGLPNSMHRDYTVRAARAGKHVFCEKPMAISSGECESMTSATRNSNLLLMVGYRIHYDPTHLAAERIVQSGALGQLQAFEGALGYSTPAGVWRLTKALGGGGSLMDLGIYPLNEIRWLANEEPSEFTAVPSTREVPLRHRRVPHLQLWREHPRLPAHPRRQGLAPDRQRLLLLRRAPHQPRQRQARRPPQPARPDLPVPARSRTLRRMHPHRRHPRHPRRRRPQRPPRHRVHLQSRRHPHRLNLKLSS